MPVRGLPIKRGKDGARLLVQLTPKASANEITGITESADGTRRLKVRLTAVPEKGKANKALVKLLAKEFHLPRTSMEIVSGASARAKEVLVKGDETAMVAALRSWLEEWGNH